MKITTVLCATSSVALEMTLLVTTRVIKMETKPAWKVGWEKNANKVVLFPLSWISPGVCFCGVSAVAY